MAEDLQTVAAPAAGWRIKLGGALFVASVAAPLTLLPLLTAMELPGGEAAAWSGVVLAGSEGLGLAAVAIMGKSGYAYIKDRVLGLLRRYGPPKEVGRTRYRIGLVLFALTLLLGWLAPYAEDIIPGYRDNLVAYAFAGDSILLISLFVLGGDFWDKLRSLFVQGAKAVFPESPAVAGGTPSA